MTTLPRVPAVAMAWERGGIRCSAAVGLLPRPEAPNISYI